MARVFCVDDNNQGRATRWQQAYPNVAILGSVAEFNSTRTSGTAVLLFLHGSNHDVKSETGKDEVSRSFSAQHLATLLGCVKPVLGDNGRVVLFSGGEPSVDLAAMRQDLTGIYEEEHHFAVRGNFDPSNGVNWNVLPHSWDGGWRVSDILSGFGGTSVSTDLAAALLVLCQGYLAVHYRAGGQRVSDALSDMDWDGVQQDTAVRKALPWLVDVEEMARKKNTTERKEWWTDVFGNLTELRMKLGTTAEDKPVAKLLDALAGQGEWPDDGLVAEAYFALAARLTPVS